jgi:uncharacterized protein (UPF0333 family)
MNFQIISSLSSSANLSLHYNVMFVYLLIASSNTTKFLVSLMEKQLHKFDISTPKYYMEVVVFTPTYAISAYHY